MSVDIAFKSEVLATAPGDQTDLAITGLVSNTDGIYELFWYMELTGGSAAFTLQPGSATSNQKCDGIYQESGGATTVAAETRTDLFMGNGDASGAIVTGHGFLTSKDGRTRIWFADIFSNRTNPTTERVCGVWTTTTSFTTLNIHCSQASRMKTGSWVHLIKRGYVL